MGNFSNTVELSRRRLREFSVISGGPGTVLYDRAALTLRPLSTDVASDLARILQGLDGLSDNSQAWPALVDIFQNYELAPVINPLEGTSALRPSDHKASKPTVAPERYLNKLAINLANDCNLACTYCYANKGLYGNPERALLGEDEIEAIILRFAERYDLIESVQFMGGEPSMNPGALRRAGEVFERLVGEGRLAAVPKLYMVTNGLRFTPAFLDVAERYKCELTVSLDGPKEVHDFVRVKAGGGGSYDAIRRSIVAAKNRGIAIEFEPTFSKRHLDCGMHLIDLCRWFYDEFGVSVLHAPAMSENRYGTQPLALTIEDKEREFCAVTEWGLDNLFERGIYLMHGFTARLLESFETRVRNKYTCPAGNALLSVSTRGEVSPCWMMTDEAPFAMGSIHDEEFLGARYREVMAAMDQYELHSHPECRVCPIQPVCFGCKGGDYHATGTMSAKSDCDWMRSMVATFAAHLFAHRPAPKTTQGYFERAPARFTSAPGSISATAVHRAASAGPLVQLRVRRSKDLVTPELISSN